MILVAYEVDCMHIIDLNDPETLSFLGFTVTDLACAWEDLASLKQEPPTWVLASRLQSLGIFGIQCQSFAPGCTEQNLNLVLWQWSKASGKTIKVIDDFKRLPK